MLDPKGVGIWNFEWYVWISLRKINENFCYFLRICIIRIFVEFGYLKWVSFGLISIIAISRQNSTSKCNFCHLLCKKMIFDVSQGHESRKGSQFYYFYSSKIVRQNATSEKA